MQPNDRAVRAITRTICSLAIVAILGTVDVLPSVAQDTRGFTPKCKHMSESCLRGIY